MFVGGEREYYSNLGEFTGHDCHYRRRLADGSPHGKLVGVWTRPRLQASKSDRKINVIATAITNELGLRHGSIIGFEGRLHQVRLFVATLAVEDAILNARDDIAKRHGISFERAFNRIGAEY